MVTGFPRVSDPREQSGSHDVFYNLALEVASCDLFNILWVTQVSCTQCRRDYTNTQILGGGLFSKTVTIALAETKPENSQLRQKTLYQKEAPYRSMSCFMMSARNMPPLL